MILASHLLLTGAVSLAADPAATSTTAMPQAEMRAVLTPEQWKLVETSMDRALAYLSRVQRADGSFPVPASNDREAQPGVTAVCILAFLSRGHLPNEGPYGQQINRAIEFVLSCQHSDGLLAVEHPDRNRSILIAECAAYNHAISGLMLSETYGMTTGKTNQRIRKAVEAALQLSLQNKPQPKRHRDDQGGWRYPRQWQSSDSDLSVSSWYLMFLRSSRNAGFEVSAKHIDEAPRLRAPMLRSQ